MLSPSSPLLASDRGRLTGPHPIIKIGQEPVLWRDPKTGKARFENWTQLHAHLGAEYKYTHHFRSAANLTWPIGGGILEFSAGK